MNQIQVHAYKAVASYGEQSPTSWSPDKAKKWLDKNDPTYTGNGYTERVHVTEHYVLHVFRHNRVLETQMEKYK